MEVDGGIRETRAGFEQSGDVVGVGVGEDDPFDDQLLVFHSIEQGLGVVPAIDDPAVLSGCWWAIGDDVAVGLEVLDCWRA